MIVDTSALIAMIQGEPESDLFTDLIISDSYVGMSASCYVEASVVIDSKNDPVLSRSFDALINELAIVIEPVTREQAELARYAYRDFGKGRAHRAQLNFGDCFSYALAKATDEPLLFKGEDFSHTDIRSAT